MDKTGIIVVSLCVVLLGWWLYHENQLAQEQMRWQQAHQQAQAANLTNTVNGATGTVTSTTSTTTMATMATATAAATGAAIFDVPVTGTEQTITMTNGGAIYTFTSRGGGLKSGIDKLSRKDLGALERADP